MRVMKIRVLKVMLITLLGLLPATSGLSADSLPIHPFKARYSGTVVVPLKPVALSVKGTMELTLIDAGNGRYQLSSLVSGVVGTINSQAEGEFLKDAIHPLRYEQTANTLKKSETHAVFNWQNKTIDAWENDEQRTLQLTDGVVDPLSLYLLAMRNLQQGRKIPQYTLLSNIRLKTYLATQEGEETLSTPLGKLRTLRISSHRDKPGSEDDITTFWFAPQLGYLPVQMVRQEEGKETLRMTIQDVQNGSR
ncbi:MAG: DUF3108 domain-containing protein [Candidatus Competibacteraceae bacterium]